MMVLLLLLLLVVVVAVGEVKLNSLIASDTIRCSAEHRDRHHDRLRCRWCCCCRSPKSSIPCPAPDGGDGSGSDLCFMLHRTQPPAAEA
uniref:Putative secreted protein n=1 Tax=Anopheles marajoara TaxID=58244 RepID=A0A2M4CAG8_9DIPT